MLVNNSRYNKILNWTETLVEKETPLILFTRPWKGYFSCLNTLDTENIDIPSVHPLIKHHNELKKREDCRVAVVISF